jgi:hypothetical protein
MPQLRALIDAHRPALIQFMSSTHLDCRYISPSLPVLALVRAAEPRAPTEAPIPGAVDPWRHDPQCYCGRCQQQEPSPALPSHALSHHHWGGMHPRLRRSFVVLTDMWVVGHGDVCGCVVEAITCHATWDSRDDGAAARRRPSRSIFAAGRPLRCLLGHRSWGLRGNTYTFQLVLQTTDCAAAAAAAVMMDLAYEYGSTRGIPLVVLLVVLLVDVRLYSCTHTGHAAPG